MSIFKKLAKKLGAIPEEQINENSKMFSSENKTEEINSERNKLKDSITANLERIGFSKDEIYEVISILNKGESYIQMLKNELIGTNINVNANESVNILNEKLREIRAKELEIAEDIRKKIAEIIDRKKAKQN